MNPHIDSPGSAPTPQAAIAQAPGPYVFILTLLVGAVGGAVAQQLQTPIPWLLGSLLAVAVCTGLGAPLAKPAVRLERWMRAFVGVALGPSVAGSLTGFSPSLLTVMLASLLLIGVLVAIGAPMFRRCLGINRAEAYLCSLPGGLSFMMALAGDTGMADGNSRPRIALVHTVRVVSLVLFVSAIAGVVGVTDPGVADSGVTLDAIAAGHNAAAGHGNAVLAWGSLALVLCLGYALAQGLNIPGGHITVPLAVSAIASATGVLQMPVPGLMTLMAMVVFGSVLGYELGNGPRREYPRLAGASLAFTASAFALAAVLAWLLGPPSGYGFLVMFLALAPGGIAEVALIAIALQLDVGMIALVHLFRFLFIMLAGPLGLRQIARRYPLKPSDSH